jgi:hypothetical protein
MYSESPFHLPTVCTSNISVDKKSDTSKQNLHEFQENSQAKLFLCRTPGGTVHFKQRFTSLNITQGFYFVIYTAGM